MSDFEAFREARRKRVEDALASRLPDEGDAEEGAGSARLNAAMGYACLNGGKRFRGLLVYACGEIAGASPAVLDVPAAAVEMVHAYSLVHDDLPAMDDDEMRRGRQSCHVAFDEATAILAGDALQTRAFEILCADPGLDIPAGRRLRMVEALARASGAAGMAGGQALDMQAVESAEVADIEHLRRIHRLKTGALIRAAAVLGGLAAPDVGEEWLAGLDRYAANVGLAFQIVDDILDATQPGENGGNGENMGGGVGQDEDKPTYTSLLGVEKARAEARDLCRHAIETAAALGDNGGFLQQLAHIAVHRSF